MGTQLPATAGPGIRAPIAFRAAGISYRIGDYYARTRMVLPSVLAAAGKGTARLYALQDVVALRAVRALREAGLSGQRIRRALAVLRERWPELEAAPHLLVTDGRSLYRVLPSGEAAALLTLDGPAAGSLAWRRIVLDVSRLTRDTAAAVVREQARAARVARRAVG